MNKAYSISFWNYSDFGKVDTSKAIKVDTSKAIDDWIKLGINAPMSF